MAGPEARGVTGSGIDALILILRFHELAVDPAQIRHQFAGAHFGIVEILRCAKELKLKARAITTDWVRLAKTPLPALAECRHSVCAPCALRRRTGAKIVAPWRRNECTRGDLTI
jgi:ABC-type bacteriocin/lantibiotic exporter with double-glycine peptidase domain